MRNLLRGWLRAISRPKCDHLYVRVRQGQDGRWRWELQEKPPLNPPQRSDHVRALDPVLGFQTSAAARQDIDELLGPQGLDAAPLTIVYDNANG